MRRTLLFTTLLAPFGFAILPLAALLVTPGGSGPVRTTVEVVQPAEPQASLTSRLPETAGSTQDSISECSGVALGS